MADWEVESETPSAQAAPPPSAPATTGGWEVESETPSAQAAPPPSAAPPSAPRSHGLARLADVMEGGGRDDSRDAALSSTELLNRPIAGAMRSLQGGIGGLLDMAYKPRMPLGYSAKYKAANPGATDAQAEQAFQEEAKKATGAKVAQHVQDVAQWLRAGTDTHGALENLGAIGEQVGELEFMGGDGLLKLIGKAPKAGEVISGAVRAAESFKQAHLVTKMLTENPRLAGAVALGLKASKEAATMYAQTFAHTEDPEQAAHAAELGAGARVAGETVITPLAKKAAQWVSERQAIPQRLRSLAQQATQNIMDRINATRPNVEATTDPSRMLPAPEGAQPFTFTDRGTPTTETPTGELVHPAGKVQQPAAFPPKYTTATGPKPVAGGEGTMGADVSTATPQPARGEVVSGGANRTTTNPAEAQRWMSDLEDLQDSPEHESLSQEQKDAIEQRRASLQDQIGMYHASPYVRRFEPIDIDSVLDHVHDFRDVGNQAEAGVKPVYETMDRLTDGRFNAMNQQFKNAQRRMYRTRSMKGYDAAKQSSEDALQEINNIFTRNAGEVSRPDYQAAVRGYRDRSLALQLHTGVQRAIDGHAEDLGELLDKRQADIHGLIGADGIENLRQLGDLMAKRSKETQEVARNVAVEWGRHGLRVAAGGTPSVIGGYLAHQMGMPAYWGMAAGGVAAQGMRKVLNMAATNPRVGTLVDYAVRNGVNPKVYAPLIARAIMVPQQEQQQPEEGQQ